MTFVTMVIKLNPVDKTHMRWNKPICY